MPYALGIDLGTTYSAAAVADGDRVEIVQLGSHAATIPSLVVLRDDGEVLVGEAAERRAATEPARTAREFKRRLGDPTPFIIGGSPFGADSLMAYVLRSIVRQVSEERGEPPALVAVTHPASFGEYKLDLLRQAVRQAEVGEAVFLPEPVAAALHYASQERIEPGATVAVYDFGGGTFDAAVLRKNEDGSFAILGHPEGLERLGGVDFDEAVFSHVAETVGRAVLAGDGGSTARTAVARLRDDCRGAKESLSADTEATIPVMLPSLQTDVRITRAELEEIVRPRVRETCAALDRAVRSASLGFDDLDRILLVGGSSRMPIVGQMVREQTGRPVSRDTHPKHTIALGAALFAGEQLTAGARPAAQERPASQPVAPAAAPAAVVPPPAPAPAAATQPTSTAAAQPPAPVSTRTPVTTTAQPTAAAAAPSDTARGALAESKPRSMRLWLIGGGALAVVAAIAAGAFALLSGGGSAGASARITGIQIANDSYQVAFNANGFTPTEAGQHMRFYWNTGNPQDGGTGDWWGASPVVVAAVSDAPSGATQLCVVVVDGSTVKGGSGNCITLPG